MQGINYFKLLSNYIKNGVPLEDFDSLQIYDEGTNKKGVGQTTKRSSGTRSKTRP